MQEIFNELKTVMEQGIPAMLCIVTATTGSTPRKAGSKMLVLTDGSIRGTIGGGSIEYQAIKDALALMSGSTSLSRRYHLEDDLQMHCGGTMDVYFESIGCLPRLYIFGGGHIGRALAGYAPALGFKPYVFDQREDIFASWNLPGVETLTGDYLQIIDSLNFDASTYLVIVTHNHEFDEKVLIACAPREYAYLGMIGSRRKIAEISNKALQENLLSATQLARIDMPIGLPFAAETPAEIAISIVAKMIDVKNSLKKS